MKGEENEFRGDEVERGKGRAPSVPISSARLCSNRTSTSARYHALSPYPGSDTAPFPLAPFPA